MLVDYADMRCTDDEDDVRCDLPQELRRDLAKARRNYFDAVCITHLDQDHCKGFGDFFWLGHAAKYQDDSRLKYPPADLVAWEEAYAYPTDFFAMSEDWIDRLGRRGEQLTKALIAEHASELMRVDPAP